MQDAKGMGKCLPLLGCAVPVGSGGLFAVGSFLAVDNFLGENCKTIVHKQGGTCGCI